MTYAWRQVWDQKPGKAWCASWGITAPWAHPAWSQYVIQLVDLTTEMDKPPILYLPDATHEFLLFAISPDHKLTHDVSLSDQTIHYLHPANYGYQFRASDDAAALKRVQAVVDEIVAERLSPDTDFRSKWNVLFQDAYPMVRSTLVEAFGAPDAVTKH